MKFNYKLSRKDYEKIIRKVGSKNDVYFIIISSILYLYVVRNLILNNFLIIFILYLITILAIYVIIKIVSLLTSKLIAKMNENTLGINYGTYIITVDKDKISEQNGKSNITIEMKDIVKTNKNKNYYTILTKKIIMIFKKELFEKDADYAKVISLIEENKPVIKHKKIVKK